MNAITKPLGLFAETAAMAFDTLRNNKMRSALTVLGVVIGVTSIVGMTSLIRGFDTSLRDSIAELGPKTIFVQRFGAVSFSSGASFMELIRRPGLTVDDGEAIRRLAPSVAALHGEAHHPSGSTLAFLIGAATLMAVSGIYAAYAFYGRKSDVADRVAAGAPGPYRLLWLVFIYLGAIGSLHLVWDIADTLNGLMAIPNLISVLASIPLLLRLKREFFATAARR